jgi:hypothetical protein
MADAVLRLEPVGAAASADRGDRSVDPHALALTVRLDDRRRPVERRSPS